MHRLAAAGRGRVQARDSRLHALGLEHGLHRQVAPHRVFAEILLRPKFVLQGLRKVPHFFPGCGLPNDWVGEVVDEMKGGEGREARMSKKFNTDFLHTDITQTDRI